MLAGRTGGAEVKQWLLDCVAAANDEKGKVTLAQAGVTLTPVSSQKVAGLMMRTIASL